MAGISQGTCRHCGGTFICTVNDEPNREWCGGCVAGEPKGSPAIRRTCGYARKGQVSEIGQSKVCPKCSLWFAAAPRQRVCDGCLPNAKKALKARSGMAVLGQASNGGKPAGHRGVKTGFREMFSQVLGLTFRCPVTDPRAARLETIVLAYERAFAERWECP